MVPNGLTKVLLTKLSDKNSSLAKSFGILERQMPITSAIGACSAQQKMLQDFIDQFQEASFMFAKFDLATLQNSRIF